MSDPSDNSTTVLEEWLSRQPVWLQYAAQSLLKGESCGPKEIGEYAKMAISEVKEELAPLAAPLTLSSLGVNAGGAVSLQSLSKVAGVAQLNPRNPLNFGSDKIAVVFGSNGSGKSSYVRVLKHACGAREKGEIHQNIFEGASSAQSCAIGYSDGEETKTLDWNLGAGVAQELSTVDIFDTHCGHSYLASEGQTSYEPRPLVFLSELATLCDQVAVKLTGAIEAKVKALPNLPAEHATTTVGKWYASLTAETEKKAVDQQCVWAEKDEEALAALDKYLAERSPTDRAKEFETKKGFIDGLISALNEHLAAFSDDACRAVMGLRQTARDSQKTAELAAKVNLEDAVLDGVGTKEWLDLWSMARAYSAKTAYPGLPFPQTGEESRCVLCHQELTEDAKRRVSAFEQYVVNEAAEAAKTAKKNLKDALDQLPVLPGEETLLAKIASAGLSEQESLSLKEFYSQLAARRDLLKADDIVTEFGACPEISEWTTAAQTSSDECAVKAKQFLEGFSEKERGVKIASQKELAARKWIAVQKSSVESEIKRLAQVATLEGARDLCGTRAISLKKGALAEELLTPAYIEAFNSELKRLGARRVRVALVKTRVARGVIMHQVVLRDAVQSKPIHEVLSEGEHRIVCLAAFLADVSSKPNGSTFVFDDPISSLDLDFEEAVVQRLVELSSTRQVIVFTHRLSLLGMVQDHAKKAAIASRVIHIRKEPWGAGEPGDETIEAAKPKAVLSTHLPTRISTAREVFEKEGVTAYGVHAQSICTETRKLIERMIEVDLLGDVVSRHRRAINTLGKLSRLADINTDDCDFLEKMMSKYSRYEHAQSAEAPVDLPEPDELSEDVGKLKVWRDELEKRRK